MRPGKVLTRAVAVRGVGLFTGEAVCARLLPAAGDGITFVRTDVDPAFELRAHVDNVASTQLCTRLGSRKQPEVSVCTVEHLLAALAGLGVRACRVELDGPELPILDGSARPWVQALLDGAPQARERGGCASARPLRLSAPIECAAGGARIRASPASRLRFSYAIDFADGAIGAQRFEWAPPEGEDAFAAVFAAELAPARTFTTAEHARALQASGRKHGGGLHNALVSDGERWLNPPPLRFVDEPARHKLLDLLGDLALCGRPLGPMHVEAHCAGHALHVELARALLAADAGAA
ncbi:UDP-3-O-acyl N-acetylglucosamine deacetylase [Pavlovales sp. CCMP2436]|nr:UDP-3-O-acyl N-acetylglucosamine deacetylase [Pavlovales sp. CCMP2436]